MPKGPEHEPPETPPEPSPEARQKQEDFYASSPELQDELKRRDEEEFWKLYGDAHEFARDEALSNVRERLHRLEQQGIEVTPEMEQRELEHAEEAFKGEARPRDEKGKFKEGTVEKFERAVPRDMKPEEVRRIMESTERANEYLEEAAKASPRTKRKIELAYEREDIDVRALAEQLRREDALANVENHIKNTSEQGARWWPWDKILARRRALRELKDKEISEDWMAYARARFYEQQEEYVQNGQSASETRRTLSASGDRIKTTWKKGGWWRPITMPARFLAEGVRLGRYAFKRGRKERQAWQQRAESRQEPEPRPRMESDDEGS